MRKRKREKFQTVACVNMNEVNDKWKRREITVIERDFCIGGTHLDIVVCQIQQMCGDENSVVGRL